jgi:hypothetical protein
MRNIAQVWKDRLSRTPDPVPDPAWPDRPTGADFILLSRVITAMDDLALDLTDALPQYLSLLGIDEGAVSYTSLQRAMRARDTLPQGSALTRLGATWLDGFITASLFYKEKNT